MLTSQSQKTSTVHEQAPFHHSYTHGAHVTHNGNTRFSLWAPDAETVSLVFLDGQSHPLEKAPEGWFSKTIRCEPGTSYQYIINGSTQVPDPAARRQHDVTGFSCVVDQTYPWETTQWRGRPWQECIFYEIHIGLLGGFNAAEKILPHLVDLGITAIEIMPLAEFPGARNWGYDGVFSFAPEMSYGTPDELKHFIDKAHSVGLMVFLDVVYNHFGSIGNYLHEYAEEFFNNDDHTPWGPGINFSLAEVRNFFYENAFMWLHEYRFDGLRFDAVHAISDKEFLIQLAEKLRSSCEPNRYIHLILENEDNSAKLLENGFDAQWNDDWHNVLHLLLTEEDHSYYGAYAPSPTDKLARCLKEGFIYQGELTPENKPRGEPSAHLSPSQFVIFLQNHDQIGNRPLGERLIHLAPENAIKAATVLLLLSPMVPLLFMGEEWGETNPFYYFTDVPDEFSNNIKSGRHEEIFSKGLSDPSLKSQDIPDPNALETFINSQIEFPNLQENTTEKISESNHQQWLLFYKTLLELRKEKLTPHLSRCEAHKVMIYAEKCLSVSWRISQSHCWNIYLNLSATDQIIDKLSPQEELVFLQGLSQDDYNQHVLRSFSAVVTQSSLLSG